MHQASVGFHCPNCVAKGKQKVVTGRAAFNAAFTPVVTYALIAINVLVFIVGVTSSSEPGQLSRRDTILLDYGLYAGTHDYYRLITSGFLHSGIIHIGFNMWALYSIGPVVERALGRLRFGLVYAIALLAGSAGAMIKDPHVLTVGASGALYGLLAGLVILYRRAGINVMRSGLGITILLNVFITLAVPYISIGGHIGGFIGGLGAAWLAVHGADLLKSKQLAVGLLAALVPAMFIVGVIVMNSA